MPTFAVAPLLQGVTFRLDVPPRACLIGFFTLSNVVGHLFVHKNDLHERIEAKLRESNLSLLQTHFGSIHFQS
jgi:hypothetical protein